MKGSKTVLRYGRKTPPATNAIIRLRAIGQLGTCSDCPKLSNQGKLAHSFPYLLNDNWLPPAVFSMPVIMPMERCEKRRHSFISYLETPRSK